MKLCGERPEIKIFQPNMDLRSGDYARDNVRSFFLHVFLFLTIFFGVWDTYINVSKRKVIPAYLFVFLYSAIVIAITLLTYPAFIGNHAGTRMIWFAVTAVAVFGVFGGRTALLILDWDQLSYYYQVLASIECAYAGLCVIAILYLFVKKYLGKENFVSQREKELDKGKKVVGIAQYWTEKDCSQIKDLDRNLDLGELLWPKRLVLDGKLKMEMWARTWLVFPSKLYIAGLLAVSVAIYLMVNAIEFGGRFRVVTDKIFAVIRSFLYIAQWMCNFQDNQPIEFGNVARDLTLIQSLGAVCHYFDNGSVELYSLVNEYQIFTNNVANGIQIAGIFALIHGTYASFISFRVFGKSFVLHHQSCETFQYKAEEYDYAYYFRHVALFVSTVLWGMLYLMALTIIGTLAFTFPPFYEFFWNLWQVVVSLVIYIAIDTYFVSRFIIPRFVVKDNEIKNQAAFRFFMLGMDIFYVPYCLYSGLMKTIYLLLFGVVALMRPDLNVLPAELKSFDRSHLAYHSMVRFHHAEVYKLKTRKEAAVGPKEVEMQKSHEKKNSSPDTQSDENFTASITFGGSSQNGQTATSGNLSQGEGDSLRSHEHERTIVDPMEQPHVVEDFHSSRSFWSTEQSARSVAADETPHIDETDPENPSHQTSMTLL